MLKIRMLTALILLPVLIAGIFYLPLLYFGIVLGLLILMGAWEWSALADLNHLVSRVIYVALIALGLIVSAFINTTWVLLFSACCWLWLFVGIIRYQRGEMAVGFQLAYLRVFIGFPVLIGTWVSMMALKAHPYFGAPWLLFVLAIIFAADTGAFFSGRFFGKRLLCSRVSPKKTWEGVWGGMAFALVVAGVGGYLFALPFKQYGYLLIVSLVAAVFSVIGDLGISLLKRIAGVKDSGAIIPGHGGILDRLDSVSAATVFFVLIALVF
jgi:phosphatidate cytidylyltransferase